MANEWFGFPCEEFQFEGKNAMVVFPREGTACGGLMIKTEYRGAFPEAAEIPLLERGYYWCFLQNDNRWGTNVDLDRKARFVRFVQEKYHLNAKVVPVGMSCGGLIAIKFAARYPDLISCLYLDAPVVNYLSCPCGFGKAEVLDHGKGIPEILNALGMDSISELLGYREMPLDMIPTLIENKIPVVLVVGGEDISVPYCENGLLLAEAYRKAGVELEVYMKPTCGHHPHGLEDPTAVVEFILRHG